MWGGGATNSVGLDYQRGRNGMKTTGELPRQGKTCSDMDGARSLQPYMDQPSAHPRPTAIIPTPSHIT
jgi:hypothetical protein